MTELEKSIKEIPALLKAIKEKFNPPKEKFGKVTTADGKTLEYDGDTLEIGASIFILDEAGNKTPAPDGEYDIPDVGIVTVKEGKVIDTKEEAKPEEDIAKQIADQIANSTAMKIHQKKMEDTFENEIKGLKARIANAEKQMKVVKELFDIIERLAQAPSLQSDFGKQDGTKKPQQTVILELDEWRKKYHLS